eukprot:TRINITY_DN2675_c0_g1_i29.p1 TRINITY_DN2675_c0_g1~~TRINITY_DN2675_c0_g1_i29.p1  ORF type:complete len:949 (+),score=131.74 TRINITY_DN2675_c0_g1_i29:473-3319(+)
MHNRKMMIILFFFFSNFTMTLFTIYCFDSHARKHKMAYFSISDGSQPMTLLESDMTVWIYNHVSCVEVTQRYSNPLTRAVEAEFVLPIDPSWVVYSLEILLPNEHIIAQVMENNVAKLMYDEAIKEGWAAVNMVVDRHDVVKTKVGNIGIGTEVVVKWKMNGSLLFEGNSLRFLLPMTISSRYVPRVHLHDQQESASKPNVYSRGFLVHVESQEEIEEIESPGFEVGVVVLHPKHKYYIKPCFDDGRWIKNFGLVLRLNNSPATLCMSEKVGQYYGVNVSTTIEVSDTADIPIGSEADYIFLADRSGSMSGGKIEALRVCLEIFLRSLPVGCRFNMVGFGSSHILLFPSPVPYNEENLAIALQDCKSMKADLGGTELLRPLRQILNRQNFRRAVIFVLTDGEVSNTREVIELVRTAIGRSQIFSFGFGRSVSYQLIRGLAEAGNGSAEFISENEDLNDKMVRALDLASKPLVYDIRVDFGNLPAPVFIPEIKSLVDGKRLNLGFVFRESTTNQLFGKHIIKLNCTVKNRPLSFNFEVDFTQLKDYKGALFRMAATNTMSEMEKRQDTNLESAMIQLSLASSIVCSKTTLFGVSKNLYITVSSHQSFCDISPAPEPNDQTGELCDDAPKQTSPAATRYRHSLIDVSSSALSYRQVLPESLTRESNSSAQTPGKPTNHQPTNTTELTSAQKSPPSTVSQHHKRCVSPFETDSFHSRRTLFQPTRAIYSEFDHANHTNLRRDGPVFIHHNEAYAESDSSSPHPKKALLHSDPYRKPGEGLANTMETSGTPPNDSSDDEVWLSTRGSSDSDQTPSKKQKSLPLKSYSPKVMTPENKQPSVQDSSTPEPTDLLFPLIRLQKIDGRWVESLALLNILKAPIEDVKRMAENHCVEIEVVLTVMALEYLSKKAQALRSTWNLIERKSRVWLSSKVKPATEQDLRVACAAHIINAHP